MPSGTESHKSACINAQRKTNSPQLLQNRVILLRFTVFSARRIGTNGTLGLTRKMQHMLLRLR
jgi:hypothetical protein